MIGYVYITKNNINGRIYIGQHKPRRNNLKDDFYIGSGKLINQAISKYGKENFTNDILCWCQTQQELDDMEIHYIKQYRDMGFNLYNLSTGGFGMSKEDARLYANKRWSQTSKDYRKNHTLKARKAYLLKHTSGQLKIKRCEECEGSLSSHKKFCSKYKPGFKICQECGGKRSHFKSCSSFVKHVRSDETKRKLSEIAKNRPKEHNLKISNTLKNRWSNGDFDYLTCKECGGKSSNHKLNCSLYKRKNRNYTPEKFYCEDCDRYISGKGNFNQHLKSKSQLKNKLNK